MTETAAHIKTAARQALAAAAGRTAELLRAVDDVDLPVPRSEWTVGDAAAHLIFALRGFALSAEGSFESWAEVSPLLPTSDGTAARVAAMNRIFIHAEPRRSPSEAAQAVIDGVDAFLTASADAPPDQLMPTPWYGEDESLTIAQATCLLLGEQVIHGYDIAQAVHRPWRITKSDARLILEAAQAMIPRLAIADAIGRRSLTYQVHPAGGSSFVVRCADGAISVETPDRQRVDCHIATDPVAFVLLGYGRITQWRAIARAKMFVWGRRPWIGLRLVDLVSHP